MLRRRGTTLTVHSSSSSRPSATLPAHHPRRRAISTHEKKVVRERARLRRQGGKEPWQLTHDEWRSAEKDAMRWATESVERDGGVEEVLGPDPLDALPYKERDRFYEPGRLEDFPERHRYDLRRQLYFANPRLNKKLHYLHPTLRADPPVVGQNTARHTEDFLVDNYHFTRMFIVNQPRTENVLDAESFHYIDQTLSRWNNFTDTTEHIIFRGRGRSFCPGMNVASLVHIHDSEAFESELTLNIDVARETLKRQQDLILSLAAMERPLSVYASGYTLGAGLGMLLSAPMGIVAEDVVCAVTQTQLGLIPDAGLTYYLPRLPHCLGYYLALTGRRIAYSDLVRYGLADFYIPRDRMQSAVDLTAAYKPWHEVRLLRALDMAEGETITKSLFSPVHLELLERLFAVDTYDEFVTLLDAAVAEGDDFARRYEKGHGEVMAESFAANLKRRMGNIPPTTREATFVALKKAENEQMSLRDCLTMEADVNLQLMQTEDFVEAVRHGVIYRNYDYIEDQREEADCGGVALEWDRPEWYPKISSDDIQALFSSEKATSLELEDKTPSTIKQRLRVLRMLDQGEDSVFWTALLGTKAVNLNLNEFWEYFDSRWTVSYKKKKLTGAERLARRHQRQRDRMEGVLADSASGIGIKVPTGVAKASIERTDKMQQDLLESIEKAIEKLRLVGEDENAIHSEDATVRLFAEYRQYMDEIMAAIDFYRTQSDQAGVWSYRMPDTIARDAMRKQSAWKLTKDLKAELVGDNETLARTRTAMARYKKQRDNELWAESRKHAADGLKPL